MTTHRGTPTKLRNGSWGAKIGGGRVNEGDAVKITTRAGKTWTATVAKVIWSGNGVTIVATRKEATRTPAARNSAPRGRLVGTHTAEPCDCGNWAGAGSRCLYSFADAKDAGMAGHIDWSRTTKPMPRVKIVDIERETLDVRW